MEKKKAIVVDVDGTLVNVDSIRHLVLEKPKNYDAFHYGSIFCPANQWVVEKVKEWFLRDVTVIVVTARKERWRDVTSNWLHDHKVPYDELHMRHDDDNRKDRLIKEEILLDLQERYDIVWAIDDNPSIIELWKEYNIPTTTVPGWDLSDTTAVNK